ncbi:2Fe-2S iron-sulfur cluster-binding protein [Achromobacter seleniivolatilans]|uniref:succinate dehydrogenase n=1 Tax=Achromobacter seleniivolatilans TaxID=3047478 RepID=A0ABY9M8S3_9BURK|nr:2Fe-2S iron-sulfur cluster-binding protein [Achromobacter sp. R39]WMD22187.1 2Fe-2S iron-sulfur cluster-binding protein [Achromobacter sp. R39]
MAIPNESETCVNLSVLRGLAEGPSHYDDYQIPTAQAASLLDALRWIREQHDDSLAFRYSCINANACKECMMQFDGKVVYACVARPVPGARHVVEPLPNKTRLRDLVTAIAPAKERLVNDESD